MSYFIIFSYSLSNPFLPRLSSLMPLCLPIPCLVRILSYCFFSLLLLSFFLDVESSTSKSGCPSAVCIPYSSVPGMDYASNVYAKAIATLAKQVHKDHHKIVPCHKLAIDSMDIGIFCFYLYSTILLTFCSLFPR